VWRSLALNSKITLTLFGVQACTLLLGYLWLSHWVQSTRFDELRHHLDTQSDVIESLIVSKGGHLVFERRGEYATELDHDHDSYFALSTADGELLIDSQGPTPEMRNLLQNRMRSALTRDEDTQLVTVGHEQWLAQMGTLERGGTTNRLQASIHVAINAQPVLNSIASFRQLVAMAALGILLLTALGSYIVVALSTRNLRRFARQLRTLKPPEFTRRTLYEPHSAEEKLLFDSYAQMERAVQEVLEHQRLFIAHASHELKTPIAAVTAALEVILAKPRQAQDYAETCQDILAEMQVLKRLSLGLLDLARLDSTTRLAEQTSELNANVLHTVERWRKAAEHKHISLAVQLLADDQTRVPGAREQWEVIIGNLLENAIKYTGVGGSITLSLAPAQGDSVALEIDDTGCGMTQEQVAQLGQVFFRADAARSPGGSFGLGFAHSKRVLEQLNGQVLVLSTPAQGTRVTVIVQPQPPDT
jgi:signal transduction histidine kinase